MPDKTWGNDFALGILVIAFAGENKTVFKNSSFSLNGMGGVNYSWTPATGLSDTFVSSPTGTLEQDITYSLQVTSNEGCTDYDEINITVIENADMYIPSASTPNNDGLNDVFRPAYIGIVQLHFFTVYNWWGKIVFSTKEIAKGWDGIFQVHPAAMDTYVWILKGVEFWGTCLKKNGSVILVC